MKKMWKKIERMIATGAVHRDGFKLDEVKLPFILEQARKELDELIKSPDDHIEMADLLAILIHYCIKQGWTMEVMESYMNEKLNVRFKIPKAKT